MSQTVVAMYEAAAAGRLGSAQKSNCLQQVGQDVVLIVVLRRHHQERPDPGLRFVWRPVYSVHTTAEGK